MEIKKQKGIDFTSKVLYMGDMLFRLSTAIMVSYALSAIP